MNCCRYRESGVKSVGKPDARNGRVRFDERGWETGRRHGVSACARPRLYQTKRREESRRGRHECLRHRAYTFPIACRRGHQPRFPGNAPCVRVHHESRNFENTTLAVQNLLYCLRQSAEFVLRRRGAGEFAHREAVIHRFSHGNALSDPRQYLLPHAFEF